jgi:ribose transport system ATP-binding protein
MTAPAQPAAPRSGQDDPAPGGAAPALRSGRDDPAAGGPAPALRSGQDDPAAGGPAPALRSGQDDPAAGGPAPALRLTALSKTFPGTRALVGVDLEVRPGEIHALVGGNGSGKSTLVRILAGVYHADPGGWIEVHGRATRVGQWSPAAAFAAAMRFVHQDPAVFRQLTVAENLAIGYGFPTGLAGRIRWREQHARAQRLIDRYQIRARPDLPVAALRPADRTMVAVARALQDVDDAGQAILVLDEPTSALPAGDVEVLLAALRRCAARAQTIVYVSHRIDEVLALADRVTVLRDGHKVTTAGTADLTEAGLVEHIAGRALTRRPAAGAPPRSQPAAEPGGKPGAEPRSQPRSQPAAGPGGRPGAASGAETGGRSDGAVVLELRGLAGGPLRGVDLRLRTGEVLGIAGLLGSGRTELLQTVFGARPPAGGQIRLHGRPVVFAGPAEAMAAGLAYVPEDRAAEGVFASLSVRENLSAGSVRRYWKRFRLQHRWERREARATMAEYLVRAGSDSAPLSTLSGGNQQKVLLARWLRWRPAVLLADEPTQGVDVGARQEIYGLIRRAAAAGTAVIVVANDFAELAELCDRVVVLAGGRIRAELTGSEVDSQRLTELAYLPEDPGEH